jgi:hypothetical protein
VAADRPAGPTGWRGGGKSGAASSMKARCLASASSPIAVVGDSVSWMKTPPDRACVRAGLIAATMASRPPSAATCAWLTSVPQRGKRM